jgi:hypothetical protein
MTSFEERHAWGVTLAEAAAIQQALRAEVITEDALGELRYVAGVDVGFEEEGTVARAAVAVLTFPDLALHEHAIAHRPVTFPYVPGYLSSARFPPCWRHWSNSAPSPMCCSATGRAWPIHAASASPVTWACSRGSPRLASPRVALSAHSSRCRRNGAHGNRCSTGARSSARHCAAAPERSRSTSPSGIASA